MNEELRLVEVEWVAAHRIAGDVWESRDDAEPMDPLPVKSVGYLVEESDSHVTLTHSFTADQFACRFCIPAGCITETRWL